MKLRYRFRFITMQKSFPKQMDIAGIKGPNAGRTIIAIYRFKNHQLTVCHGLKGNRPTAFHSAKGSVILLVEFEKSPKSKKSLDAHSTASFC